MSQAAAKPVPEDAKSQIYVSTFHVGSRSEAEVLAKSDVWEILTYLHRKGPKGATADEISREVGVSLSVTYSTLKELRKLDIVRAYPREEGKRKMRKKAYAFRTDALGQCHATNEFAYAMKMSGELEHISHGVNGPLLQALDDAYAHFVSRRELQPFLPSDDPGAICPRCHRNHEAVEFFRTICLLAVQDFISESGEFQNFLAQKKFTAALPGAAPQQCP